MDEFKPIETQDELNEVIKKRLAREKAKFEKEAAELKAQVEELTAKTAELTALTEKQASEAENNSGYAEELEALRAKVTGYETAEEKRNILKETGLPEEMYTKLAGDCPDAWRADARKMLGYLRNYSKTPPLADLYENGENSERAALRSMLDDMKGY